MVMFFICMHFQQEDYTDCGGVSGLNPSLWSIIGLQFLLLWLVSGRRHYLWWPSDPISATTIQTLPTHEPSVTLLESVEEATQNINRASTMAPI